MELRDLRYFLILSDEGSLLAAAKRLRIAPSILGQQSYRMERELRAKLFIRRGGSVALTITGQLLRAHARNILKYVSVATDAVREAGKTS